MAGKGSQTKPRYSSIILSAEETCSSVIGNSPTIFTDGTSMYLVVRDETQACMTCRKPCLSCKPPPTCSRSTNCSLPSTNTIGTDTLDLAYEDKIIRMPTINVKVESTVERVANISDTGDLVGVVEYTKGEAENVNFEYVKKERLPRAKLKTKRHICDVCLKAFRTARGLRDHGPVHTGDKNYVCDFCKKAYTTRSNLLVHKRTHLGVKLYSCDVCMKQYQTKDSLNVHLRTHTGERPFTCEFCNQGFMRKNILKSHLTRHISPLDKVHICAVCGTSFGTLPGLKHHESCHNGRKPKTHRSILCQLCGKIFSSMSNFKGHEKVHVGQKPFECKLCERRYAKKSSLVIHQRSHSDERLYSCDLCDYAAFRRGTLKTHMYIHTKEKPYKCEKCPAVFSQSASLHNHFKQHHLYPLGELMSVNL